MAEQDALRNEPALSADDVKLIVLMGLFDSMGRVAVYVLIG